MAAANKATVFMSGKVYWAKVLGEPRPNYNGDGREWAFEFEPDEDGAKLLKQHKLTDRLKDKYEDRGKFLVLRKKEFSADGSENQPIRIYDADDNAWDASKLLGNGTAVDVKLDIRDYGPGKKKGVYPVAIRVKDLIQYQSSEFGGMDKDEAPNPKKDAVKEDFKPEELNDDLAF